MRVKVDEDLPSAATQLLRGHRFDTVSVVEAGIRPVLELLEDVLAGDDLEDLSGAIAVASSQGIRIRRQP